MPDSIGDLKGTIELRVGSCCAKIDVTAPRGDVPFRDVIPIARQMVGAVVDWALDDMRAREKAISCGPGCGACCRQPVPIAHAEARRLAALVESLPEPRRSIVRERFAAALRKLRSTDLLQELADLLAADDGVRPAEYFESWAKRYFEQGIPCPFLEHESCSIHPERPLICREYLVTSPPSACAALDIHRIDRVLIATSVHKAVRRIGKEGESSAWIPLVSVLEWAEGAPSEEKRLPAIEWVRQFQVELGKKPAGDAGSVAITASD